MIATAFVMVVLGFGLSYGFGSHDGGGYQDFNWYDWIGLGSVLLGGCVGFVGITVWLWRTLP